MEIPEPIWNEICVYLQAKDLCNLALVNKYFYDITSNNYIWLNLMKNKFIKIPKFIDSYKKSFAEINCMATTIIGEYQFETHNLENALIKERNRQSIALEIKKLERQLNRALKKYNNS